MSHISVKNFQHLARKYQNILSILLLLASITITSLFLPSCENPDAEIVRATFLMKGTYLTDPCGDTIILKGVNKMSVFDSEDPNGSLYFPEIAKTNANSVRIVWKRVYNNGTPSQPAQLDALISNCIKAKMIPIVEMHDATCDWSELNNVVNYWISPDIISIVKKYQHAMIVNIANEAGNDAVTAEQYKIGYENAITALRNAGIKTTLMIDAPDCGKNLEFIVPLASGLILHDPYHNLLFSVHPYWPITAGATPAFIKGQLDNAANNNVPLVLGELCAYGGYPGLRLMKQKPAR